MLGKVTVNGQSLPQSRVGIDRYPAGITIRDKGKRAADHPLAMHQVWRGDPLNPTLVWVPVDRSQEAERARAAYLAKKRSNRFEQAMGKLEAMGLAQG